MPSSALNGKLGVLNLPDVSLRIEADSNRIVPPAAASHCRSAGGAAGAAGAVSVGTRANKDLAGKIMGRNASTIPPATHPQPLAGFILMHPSMTT
jgi:hypothetical protein